MKLPRWKKEQRKRKEQKILFVARLTLLAIFLILLAGIGWKVYGSLKKSVWDGKSRLTLVFNSQPLLLASFSPSKKTLHGLLIPDHALVETAHGYGLYQAGSLWHLAEMENYGPEFLADSLQEHLGVPIDAYASVSSVKYQVSSIETKGGILAVIQFLLKDSGQTNLTRWDLIRLWWGIKKVRFDKVRLVDLGETEALEEIILPDGTPALKANSARLDQLVGELFLDWRIKKEALAIGVFNASQEPGLAKKAARMINNIGGQIVEVGDWRQGNEKCEVRSEKKLAGSYTAQKLRKIFNCQYGGSQMGESGAEIIIILVSGED